VPDKEALTALVIREIKSLEILLWGGAMRSAITLEEYIGLRVAQGVGKEIIKAELLLDLETGGRIFGEFRRSVQATANGSIHRFRDAGMTSEIGLDTNYKWVAVLVNTCPDCMDRHGREQSWEEWENEGMPRTGHTVCRQNCKCMLIPEDATNTEVIKRDKRKSRLQ